MSNLLWVDLEMTGLNVARERILEAAVIVTDSALNPLETFSSAVWQPQSLLDQMDEWNKTHHAASGLLDRVPSGISESELDAAVVAIIQRNFPGEPPVLCGNSIHQDRKFIDAYLPETASALHYRMLDVSSFKIVFQQLHGVVYPKSQKHEALEDILESIEELRFYMQAVDFSRFPVSPVE